MSLAGILACERRLMRDSVCVLFPERSSPSITMNAPRLDIVRMMYERKREKVLGVKDVHNCYIGAVYNIT